MEASLRSRAGAGQGGFALRPEQSGKYFRPALAPTGKNSGATRVQRPGKFFACDFWADKISGSSGSAGKNFAVIRVWSPAAIALVSAV